MKKAVSFLLSLALLLALGVSALAAETEEPALLDSGGRSLSKLSQAEITQLLTDNPLTLTGNVFEEEPSCTAPYAPGRITEDALKRTAGRLNALRRIAGLPAVALDDAMNESAQYGAVLVAASEFSHYPPKPDDMDEAFYNTAKAATSSSNIYGGTYSAPLIRAVDSFMDDSDASNVSILGHRRWQLNPAMGKTGFGYAKKTGTSYAFVTEKAFDTSAPALDYDFISWPASGYFPSTLFTKNTAWSVTLNPAKYAPPSQSALSVTLRRESDGKTWTFSDSQSYTAAGSGAYFHVDLTGYGVANCVMFRPDEVEAYSDTYTVSISGVKDRSGQSVPLSYQVTFFDPLTTSTSPGGDGPSDTEAIHFDDVSPNAYFHDAVEWAVKQGITNGTTATTFSPSDTCTRAHILTFLWRAFGSPEPGIPNPFTDVAESAYYYKAALWSFENGLIYGKTFAGGTPCTRAATVMYLWKLAGYPAAGECPFTDVSVDDAQPVAWAVAQGITNGTTATTFAPTRICTRAQIATFLYRALAQ